jgi:CTP:molybdopterin cytidylyltransferase MocA
VEEALESIPGLHLVRHEGYRDGQQSSVQAGVRALRSLIGAAEAVAVVLCDQPLLEPSDFLWLRKAWARREPSCAALIPVHQGQRGNPVVFGRDCLEEILAEDAEGGARRFIERHPSRVRRIEAPNDHFCVDLDTREDLARWRARDPRSA